MSISQPYTVPQMYDIFMLLKDEILKALRCLMPATITAVNDDGTVNVQIAALQQTPTGQYLNYPPLQNLPTVILQGGGLAFKAPIAVGDQCLVFFADRCMAAWKQTGTPQPLPNPRLHDLSDGFALIGVNSPAQLVTLLTDTEGGIATKLAKVAIDTETNLVTIATGAAGVNNLATTLQLLMTTLGSLNAVLGAMTTATIASGTTQGLVTALDSDFIEVATQLELILQ